MQTRLRYVSHVAVLRLHKTQPKYRRLHSVCVRHISHNVSFSANMLVPMRARQFQYRHIGFDAEMSISAQAR